MNSTNCILRFVFSFLFVFALGLPEESAAQNLELKKGDRICVIGNTMADRMQHDGWFESFLQQRFPNHQLVVRHLGFSADTLETRLRSANFGSPDDHLGMNEADVIVMMFGYNESFAGEAGLEDFKKSLTDKIEHMRSQNYNGKTGPRIMVVSPIAHEDLKDRNLPNGVENNQRLAIYTEAMKQVCSELKAPFVDLFSSTKGAYAAGKGPLTLNGIHLTSKGNRFVGEEICNQLFGKTDPTNNERVEAIRTAVLDKNFHWYNFYRITDGYSVYGGRSGLKFVNGQTNRVVAKREMDILFMMTANRDPAVWAAANGKSYKVDDSDTPPFIPVTTNKPGKGPNGLAVFRSGEETIPTMKMADGFKVNLFADEKMFPELVNPVQMAFDAKGRLWVATWPSYPHWKPKDPMADRLLILEDTDGDGRADKCKTFAGDLHNPTGFEFWNGGVLLAAAPDLLFLEDTDGDDVCDKKTRLVHGLDSADTHHSINSFVLGPGGGLYTQEGVFHHTQVETPYGPALRNINAGLYRYDPRKQEFMVYSSYPFANPHGHVFDRWGQHIFYDGTGAVPYHGTLISGHLDFPKKHNRAPVIYDRRTRPLPAIEMVTGDHFPEDWRGDLLVLNVIGDLGILRYELSENGASMSAKELKPLLLSDDQNFRPVDAEFGPRGDLFFVDWSNSIIGHMQHNLRDPNRDNKHGRVYRVTYEKNELQPAAVVSGQPLMKVLDVLKSSDDRARYRARIEISNRKTPEVETAIKLWISQLNTSDPNYGHQLTEALWVHQQHNLVDAKLLRHLLESKEPEVRYASARVLCYWRDEIKDSNELFLNLAGDEHPRVRLEAVRAASYLDSASGIAVVMEAMKKPTDRYLNYVIGETMRAFDSNWQSAVVEKGLLTDDNPAGTNFVLDRMSIADISKVPPNATISQHLIYRAGVDEATRASAVARLAELEKRRDVDVLLDALSNVESAKTNDTVVYELVRLLSKRSPDELKSVRAKLISLTEKTKRPLLRQIGYIGMITADDSVDQVWEAASQSPDSLLDLVSAMPQIPDPNLQADLFPKVMPLLTALPANLDSEKAGVGQGRYVRIQIPGNKKTLTLAEVEVFSGGVNIAPQGKASQSSTSHNGNAGRAIDQKRSPRYADAGQTHTAENRKNPWWELDLGSMVNVEKVVIFNRGDGLGKRLNNFDFTVLDDSRQVVFEKKKIPAPNRTLEIQVDAISTSDQIRWAAIDAVTYVRGKETESFNAIADLLSEADNSNAATRSLQRIPTQYWNKEKTPTIANTLLERLNAIPAAQRNSAAAADTIQLLESLSGQLPEDQGSKVRTALSELSVKIIRLGTKPHRMAYDKELLVVKTGKTVEFIFENSDMMPHNLVITRPGKMEEIGAAAEVMSQDPRAAQRNYVPRSKDVLLSSKLIQPGQTQKLSFTAPNKPGIYPYVCTYPGHWRRMFGSLIVVEDPEKYRAGPEAYLAANKLEIQDELLKLNARTKTEWKIEDFDNAFTGKNSEYLTGRNFARGKQMFKLASCISCHEMDTEGYNIGPDLTKDLDPKWKARDILNAMLVPSEKIDGKYKTQIVLLDDGTTASGIVTFEDEHMIKLVENPLVQSDPRNIQKKEIEDQKVSEISVMPIGILDNLTREEVLDLVAYVEAKGDAKSPLFSSHDH